MAAPVIESRTSNTTTGSSITLTKPSGVATNDLLIILVGNDDTTDTAQWDNTTNKPTGFTLIREVGASSVDTHTAAFYRVADGTEGATINVPAQSSDDYWGEYIRISNPDTTTPIDATSGGTGIDAHPPWPIDTSTIDTSVDDCLCFYVMTFDGADQAGFTVSGGSWAEVNELTVSSGPNGCAGTWGTMVQSTAGTVPQATVDDTTDDGASFFQFAVAPGAGGGGPTPGQFLRRYEHKPAPNTLLRM